jgi:hypothetical protein
VRPGVLIGFAAGLAIGSAVVAGADALGRSDIQQLPACETPMLVSAEE